VCKHQFLSYLLLNFCLMEQCVQFVCDSCFLPHFVIILFVINFHIFHNLFFFFFFFFFFFLFFLFFIIFFFFFFNFYSILCHVLKQRHVVRAKLQKLNLTVGPRSTRVFPSMPLKFKQIL